MEENNFNYISDIINLLQYDISVQFLTTNTLSDPPTITRSVCSEFLSLPISIDPELYIKKFNIIKPIMD